MTTRLTLAAIAGALALTACDQTAAPNPKAPAASGGSVAGERPAGGAPSHEAAPKPDAPDGSKPATGAAAGTSPTPTASKPVPTSPAGQPAGPAATPPAAPAAKPPAPKPPTDAPKETVLKHTETNTGLIIDDLKFGDGVEAKPHQTVTIHYRGTLADGTEFDSSYKTGKPATFGLDSLIKGWQEGIPGMKIGGKRRLIVPPDLGYGKREIKGPNGQVLIPPDSMLIFEIELFGAQ